MRRKAIAMNLRACPNSKWEKQLACLVDEKRFGCVYEPIASLTTGECLGWDALFRCPGRHYFQDVGHIFQAAERAGRIVELETQYHLLAISRAASNVAFRAGKLVLNATSMMLLTFFLILRLAGSRARRPGPSDSCTHRPAPQYLRLR